MNRTNQDGLYRKHNDRTCNSGTYHKNDCTNVRAALLREARKEVDEAFEDLLEAIEEFMDDPLLNPPDSFSRDLLETACQKYRMFC